MRGVVAAILLSCSLGCGATAAFAETRPPLLPSAHGFDLRKIAPAVALPLVKVVFTPTTPRPLGTPTLAPPPVAASIAFPPASVFPLGGSVVIPTTLPLAALVDANAIGDLDDEATCLATAVYFESKGEPLEGQLAVAHVVMNRAASGRYPTSLCGVVRQRAQFSFVRRGLFPRIDPACSAWRKARAIARVARLKLAPALPGDVLWYHADYVAPRWRQALVRFEKVGRHIFYRT